MRRGYNSRNKHECYYICPKNSHLISWPPSVLPFKQTFLLCSFFQQMCIKHLPFVSVTLRARDRTINITSCLHAQFAGAVRVICKKDNDIAVTSLNKISPSEDGIFSIRTCFLSVLFCFVSFPCSSGITSTFSDNPTLFGLSWL